MTKQNAETTKPVAVETVTKSTPVSDRKYRLLLEPSIAPKGKQRQIVLAALKSSKEPMSVEQVFKFAEANGLVATGGVMPSVRYHLHHLTLLGVAEVVNPTIAIEKPAKATVAA